MRRHYLVTYDIADDKRRNHIFETLKDQGDHVQYSVFFCELNAIELALLRTLLQPVVHAKEDQIMIVDLGLSHAPLEAGIECLGKPYDPTIRTMIF